MLTALAPAKVNLFLHVGAVQPNGRHPLDSLVVFAGPEAADSLSAEPAFDLTLTLSGPFAAGLEAGQGNLVLIAAHALRAAARVTTGAALSLEKQLPVAAGIGGGSADAAAALRLLTQLWDIDPRHAQAIAPALGGDVPVALHGQSALMQGEGERIVPVSIPGPVPALLVNPGLACPTGPVFGAFDAGGGGEGFAPLAALPDLANRDSLIAWLAAQRNALEAPALSLHPELEGIATALTQLPGARLTRMSGSGATFWSLFDTLDAARAAATILSAQRPGWWVRATLLGAAA